MSVTDLIADQLTIIRNAIRAGKNTVIIKNSKIIKGIVDIAKKEGFIENYQVIEDNKQGKIKVYLRYLNNGKSAVNVLKRVSTPGLRAYVPAKRIKSVLGGVGIAVYSTDKGLLTDKEARSQGVGGELICQIW